MISKMTAVIYENPLRLQKILPEAVAIMGKDTPACLAVDLTKVSQKIIRGSLSQLLEASKEKRIKGELVLLISVGS
ncbi:MAG: Ribosomal RNA small subunit methyltransferase I [Candidatus Collierbacteria bacterium GW2011_GWF2_42_51]|nr:MAG: Ribosomal RNA small subunit methyltransferase I [Candidatus Collierbacteria bacterium GW2011_GWF2_42_51]